MSRLSKNTFEQYAKTFGEVTTLSAKDNPDAFISFCNYLAQLEINNNLKKIMTHLEIDQDK